MAKPIPEGAHKVIPHLIVKGADRAIDFYRRAFGAEEVSRAPAPDGKTLMHAEIRIGDHRIYLADEMPGVDACTSPQTLKGTSVTIHLWSENADADFNRAVQAGGKVLMPLMDMFWGDRYGQIYDPFGHLWSIATHKEDLSPEEMGRRAAEFFASMPPPKPRRKATAKKKATKAKKAVRRSRKRKK